MNIHFIPMTQEHQKEVMSIFNYYVENTTRALMTDPLPESAFSMLLGRAEGFPSYIVINNGEIIGFCQMYPVNPFRCFSRTADVTCFLKPEYTGKGIGKICLERLEKEGREKGVSQILADVCSEDDITIRFNTNNGFRKVGELEQVGLMYGRDVSIIIMQKSI